MFTSSHRIVIDGIRLDRVISGRPGILESVPASDIGQYELWRGIHLGKIACNLLQGKFIVNSGANNEISFGSYFRARANAGDMARREAAARFQYRPEDAHYLYNRLGLPAPLLMPTMVVALDPSTELGPEIDIERYDRVVRLDELAGISRAALEEVFEISLG